MRRPLPLSVRICAFSFLACAFAGSAYGQSASATTDPVGFITLSVPGGAQNNPTLSFKSLGLTRPVEFQGNAETAGGTSIQDLDSNWVDDQFNGAAGAYYLEITGAADAPGVGTTYDIVDTVATSHTITLAQSLATGVGNGATFRIRKHWTVASVFGTNNSAGLAQGTASTADTILIYNHQGPSYDTYFYSDGGAPGIGWRKSGTGDTDQAGAVIYPDDGLLISRKGTSTANIVLMGSVKTGATSYPVLAGLNIIGNPFASSMTLDDSKLYTGDSTTGVAAGTASTADLVQIYNGSTYDTYFYCSGGAAGVGWRRSGTGATSQATQSIPMGSAIIIQRRNGAPFNWVIPQHPASL